MLRHELLGELHRRLQPVNYFEIGVRKGRSLTLSRARTVAVDPFFVIDTELHCDLHLVRATSDEFFSRKHPFAHFDEPRFDLAFIDGMHLSEYALRDVINTERWSHPGSVIVIDDMLPRSSEEAGRERRGEAAKGAWAGDVYKITEALRRLRPDLVTIEVDTEPTGTVVILLPDARDRSLAAAYDDLVEEFVVEDPQVVSDELVHRRLAVDPQHLLDSVPWAELAALRGLSRGAARERARALLDGAGLLKPVAAG